MAITRADFAEIWGFLPDSPLLEQALTQRSAVADPRLSNERLEFLGDALASAYVAEYLITALPDADEGTLSRSRASLVRREALARTARSIGLPDLLIVAPGERKENRHHADSPLADAYEAIIAALFLEAGGSAARAFVHTTLADSLATVAQSPPEPDAKTRLQMLLQARGQGLPTYVDAMPNTEETGTFAAEVYEQDGRLLGRGAGSNKRTAQTIAADNAIALLMQENRTSETK